MKINEVISEGKLRPAAVDAIPNMRVHPDLDNSSPYKAYRYGVMMAGAPHAIGDTMGPIGQKMVTIGYTTADDEIVQATDKIMGSKSHQITTDKSSEMDWVNTDSPVQAKGPIQLKSKK